MTSIILWVCLTTIDCYAQDDYHLILTVPKGILIKYEGIQYKAYTLSEYKTIAHIIAAGQLCGTESKLLEAKIASFQAEIALWEDRVEIWKELAEEQKLRGDGLVIALQQEKEYRLKIEKRQTFLGWIPWALLVVESAVVVFASVTD